MDELEIDFMQKHGIMKSMNEKIKTTKTFGSNKRDLEIGEDKIRTSHKKLSAEYAVPCNETSTKAWYTLDINKTDKNAGVNDFSHTSDDKIGCDNSVYSVENEKGIERVEKKRSNTYNESKDENTAQQFFSRKKKHHCNNNDDPQLHFESTKSNDEPNIICDGNAKKTCNYGFTTSAKESQINHKFTDNCGKNKNNSDFSHFSEAYTSILNQAFPEYKELIANDNCEDRSTINPKNESKKGTISRDFVLCKKSLVFEKIRNEKRQKRLQRKRIAERRGLKERSHVFPNVSELDHERALKKMATKGVVKFFNILMNYRKGQTLNETTRGQNQRKIQTEHTELTTKTSSTSDISDVLMTMRNIA